MAFNQARYASLIGTKIGSWTILDVFQVKWSDANRAMCRCRCDCGTEKNVLWRLLQRGQSKSCGCLYFPGLKRKYPALYGKWKSMNARCRSKDGLSGERYYKRGIKVCDEWRCDARAFINWSLANGWADGLEIDRIDNAQGYSPANCRWVTHKENCRNRTNNHMISFRGKTMCLQAWSEELGISRKLIQKKLRFGKDIEEVVSDLSVPNKPLRVQKGEK